MPGEAEGGCGLNNDVAGHMSGEVLVHQIGVNDLVSLGRGGGHCSASGRSGGSGAAQESVSGTISGSSAGSSAATPLAIAISR